MFRSKTYSSLFFLLILASIPVMAIEESSCKRKEAGLAAMIFDESIQPHRVSIRVCEYDETGNTLKPIGAFSVNQLKAFLEKSAPGNSIFSCFAKLGNASSKDGVLRNLSELKEPLVKIDSPINLPADTYTLEGTLAAGAKGPALQANQDTERIKCAQQIAQRYNEFHDNQGLRDQSAPKGAGDEVENSHR